MRPATRITVLSKSKNQSYNLLPLEGGGFGSSYPVYGNWHPVSRTDNTITASLPPANAFFYRVNVKPNTIYRVTSPLPAQAISGFWDIVIPYSDNGSTLTDFIVAGGMSVANTEFFITTPSTIVSLEVCLRRLYASSTNAIDTCLFYGFSMYEVL